MGGIGSKDAESDLGHLLDVKQTDFSQVGILDLPYKFVNFGAKKNTWSRQNGANKSSEADVGTSEICSTSSRATPLSSANRAEMRQSRPDTGPGFQVKAKARIKSNVGGDPAPRKSEK